VRAWVADSTHRLVRGRLVRSPRTPLGVQKQDGLRSATYLTVATYCPHIRDGCTGRSLRVRVRGCDRRDVFRNLGYENVRQADRTADEGRDVIMEEVVDGTRRAIIVECKTHGDGRAAGRSEAPLGHRDVRLRRPQTRMVVTTGRFTNPAQEYAQRLQQNDDPHPIELLDGEDLREIADDRSRSLQRPHRDPLRRDATPLRPSGGRRTRPSRRRSATSRTSRLPTSRHRIRR